MPEPVPVDRDAVAEVLSGRLGEIRARMDSEELAALVVRGRGVVGSYGLFSYFTGRFPSPKGAYLVIARNNKSAIIAGSSDEATALRLNLAPETSVRFPREGEPVVEEIMRAVLEAAEVTGRRRVGIAEPTGRGLPSADQIRIESLRPSLEISDCSSLVQDAKSAKVAFDHQRITDVMGMLERSIDAFAKVASIGMSEWEAAGAIEQTLRSFGAATTIVEVSGGPFLGQGPSGRRFQPGDLVTVLTEASSPDGYWGELGVLFQCTGITRETQRVANICRPLLKTCEESLVEGVRVDAASVRILDEIKRCGVVLRGRLGHAVGIDEEAPAIVPNGTSALHAGMILSMHPAIKDPSSGAAATSCNTYIVGEKCSVPLSDYPKRLWWIQR